MDKNMKVAAELTKLAKTLTAAPNVKEEFQVIVDYVDMTTEEDDWEKGAFGRSMGVFEKSNFGRYSSVDAAVKAVADFLGFPDDGFEIVDDGRLSNNFMVDGANDYVGDDRSFLKKFEKGEVRAWIADVNIYVHFAKVWTPDESELKRG